MKILLAHNFYTQGGGEDHVFAEEGRLLREAGHQVIEYTLHNDAVESMGRLELAAATIWNSRCAADLRKILRGSGVRVAHFHNTFPLISPSAWAAAHDSGTAVVQTLHNYRLLCSNAVLFREGQVCEQCLSKNFAWPGIVHRCYRGSRLASGMVAALSTVQRGIRAWHRLVDCFITPSEFARQKFIAGNLPSDRIYVKPNCVTPDPGASAAYENSAVFVGRLSFEKGLDVLVKAWESLPSPIPLKIIGDGPLAPMAAELSRKNPWVHWMGKLPIQEVYHHIGASAVLVLASETYETFGRVAVEAFAKGVPVLAPDHGPMRDIVHSPLLGQRFIPGNPADLARQVQAFFAQKEEWPAMRTAARREFEEKYTGPENLRQLLEIYNHAIDRFSGRQDL
jgi:glycosyltransferase involved in cell wall biosynthesis